MQSHHNQEYWFRQWYRIPISTPYTNSNVDFLPYRPQGKTILTYHQGHQEEVLLCEGTYNRYCLRKVHASETVIQKGERYYYVDANNVETQVYTLAAVKGFRTLVDTNGATIKINCDDRVYTLNHGYLINRKVEDKLLSSQVLSRYEYLYQHNEEQNNVVPMQGRLDELAEACPSVTIPNITSSSYNNKLWSQPNQDLKVPPTKNDEDNDDEFKLTHGF